MRSPALCVFVAVLVCVGLLAIASETKKEPEFVSSKKCKVCHSKPKLGGAEYLKWQKGPHAGAYKSLLTERGKEVAAMAGVADPLDPEKCLRCHITTLKFEKESQRAEGIGCEGCHGPGSLYRKKSVMEDYEASLKVGLRKIKGDTPEETMKNIEKQCRECHGLEHKEENPTAQEFKMEEFWAKVKHDEETLKEQFPEAFK